MKITYFITRGDDIGGAQVHVADCAHGLIDRGHEVEVLCGGTGAWVDSLRAAQIPVIVIPSLCHAINPVKDYQAYRDICRILQKNRPDLFAIHSSKAGVLGRLAAWKYNIPALYTVHGWSFSTGIPQPRKCVFMAIESLLDRIRTPVIAVSRYDFLLSRAVAMRSPIRTIHNGIPDTPQPPPDRGHKEVQLAVVARMSSQKDHPTLFAALAQLRDLPWRVRCVGDGPRMAQIIEMATRLGIADRIDFLGQRGDVSQLLAQSDIFALPSNWEGLPISILEAMRSSLPVVASRVGGCFELVRHKRTGLLVPQGDAKSWEAGLREMINDPQKRLAYGDAGRARFIRRFTREHMLNLTETAYCDAVASFPHTASPGNSQ